LSRLVSARRGNRGSAADSVAYVPRMEVLRLA